MHVVYFCDSVEVHSPVILMVTALAGRQIDVGVEFALGCVRKYVEIIDLDHMKLPIWPNEIKLDRKNISCFTVMFKQYNLLIPNYCKDSNAQINML